ncbi:MAG: AraC family transcriptional regulator [Minicystis sp.]
MPNRAPSISSSPHVATVTAPEPPPRLRIVETADVDVARRAFSSLYASSTLEPGHGPFECTLDVARSGAVNVVTGWWRSATLAIVRGGLDRYVITLPAAGSGAVEQAGERHEVMPGRGAVLSPGLAPSFGCSPEFVGYTITIQRGALEDHLAKLTDRAVRGPIRFDVPLDVEDRKGATFLGVLELFRREVERPGVSPLAIAALRDALFTSLLTGVRHSASALLEPRPARLAPWCVRRAEEYIEAHAAEPITMTDVAAAIGVPARSLRAAFASSRGVSPMAVLRQRRFELARARLASASPGTTVASVAATLGFRSAGRFSVAYRARFGESPSETLARRSAPRR